MQLKFQFSSLQLNISFPLRAHLSSWLGSGLWGTALSQPIPALGSSQSTGRVRHTQKPFPRGVGSAVTKGVLAGWSGALPTVVGGVGVGDRQKRPFFFFKIFLVWTIFKVFIEFARRGSQGASRAAPGKSGLNARGEGERVLALESREGAIDSSPPASPIPGILQARTLEWGAISFSKA